MSGNQGKFPKPMTMTHVACRARITRGLASAFCGLSTIFEEIEMFDNKKCLIPRSESEKVPNNRARGNSYLCTCACKAGTEDLVPSPPIYS